MTSEDIKHQLIIIFGTIMISNLIVGPQCEEEECWSKVLVLTWGYKASIIQCVYRRTKMPGRVYTVIEVGREEGRSWWLILWKLTDCSLFWLRPMKSLKLKTILDLYRHVWSFLCALKKKNAWKLVSILCMHHVVQLTPICGCVYINLIKIKSRTLEYFASQDF